MVDARPIALEVLEETNLAQLIIEELLTWEWPRTMIREVESFHQRRNLVLARWLCTFWARNEPLWRGVCATLLWHAARLVGVSSHRQLYLKHFCNVEDLLLPGPKKKAHAPPSDFQFMLTVTTSGVCGYHQLVETVLQGADAQSAQACQHFWPEWESHGKTPGLCWTVTPDPAVLKKLGLDVHTHEQFKEAYARWYSSPHKDLHVSLEVFCARDQKICDVIGYQSRMSAPSIEDAAAIKFFRSELEVINFEDSRVSMSLEVNATFGLSSSGNEWQFCIRLVKRLNPDDQLQLDDDDDPEPELSKDDMFDAFAHAVSSHGK